ncbi:MAG: Dam family site-specific DNA-(adenine-N6)-methyltransferase, partial [candidate division WOR-3 bacterium]
MPYNLAVAGKNGLPRPFLKWAGGKAQILPELVRRIPHEFNAYHEPFLGGGALFFALARDGRLDSKSVFLSDSNQELVNAFVVVRDNPGELLEILMDYQARNTREDYYRIRAERPRSPIKRAARLIYLNRTCYNGLYRVNSKGEFNVPYGRYKNPRIYDPDNILAVSKALQGVEILCEDEYHDGESGGGEKSNKVVKDQEMGEPAPFVGLALVKVLVGENVGDDLADRDHHPLQVHFGKEGEESLPRPGFPHPLDPNQEGESGQSG